MSNKKFAKLKNAIKSEKIELCNKHSTYKKLAGSVLKFTTWDNNPTG
jgi:hypothetical protein